MFESHYGCRIHFFINAFIIIAPTNRQFTYFIDETKLLANLFARVDHINLYVPALTKSFTCTRNKTCKFSNEQM